MSKTVAVVSLRITLAAACTLLLACGPGAAPEQAEPTETPAPPQETAPQAHLESSRAELSCPSGTICPPTVSISCTRPLNSTANINCTASASGGVPPYRFFWRTDYYYYDTGSTSVGSYYEGSSSYGPQTCPFGRYVDPYEWMTTVYVYAVDANGYSSTNTASAGYYCAQPSGGGW